MKPTFLLAFLLFSLLSPAQTAPAKSKKITRAKTMRTTPAQAAQAIHQSALIVDTHADTPQRFLDEHFDLDEDTPASDGHMDFGKIRKGNLGAEFFSIWVEPDFKGHYARRTMDLIDSVYQQAARHPDKMVMAFTAEDIVRAHQQHKF